MRVADLTCVTTARGKWSHAMPIVGEALTICGVRVRSATITAGAMPSCPRCLGKMEMR